MILKYTYNSIAEIEDITGLSITELFLKGERTGFKDIRALIWGGLLYSDRKLTLEQAGDKIQEELDNGKTIQDIVEEMQIALKNSGVLGEQQARVN